MTTPLFPLATSLAARAVPAHAYGRGDHGTTQTLPKSPAMRDRTSLDDWLPLVFVAFALLCGATLWQELSSPSVNPPHTTSA